MGRNYLVLAFTMAMGTIRSASSGNKERIPLVNFGSIETAFDKIRSAGTDARVTGFIAQTQAGQRGRFES